MIRDQAMLVPSHPPGTRWIMRGGVLAAAGLSLFFPELCAQRKDLSVEVGVSSVAPPSGVEGEDARFFVGGLRGFLFNSQGSGFLTSFLVGRATENGTGGDFLSGTVEGHLQKSLGTAWSAGLEIRGFGYRVADPFPYESLGVEGGPTLRFNGEHLAATLKGTAGGGWSQTEFQRTGQRPSQTGPQRTGQGPSQSVRDELWRYGGTGEFLAGSRGITAGFALGIHESSGGLYSSAGLRLLASRGEKALELRVDSWDTPSGRETTGGVAFIVALGRWDVRGFLGLTEPDPLTLAEPGGGSGGILVGRRLLARTPVVPTKPRLHQVLARSEGTATVEIHVAAPEGTGKVEVIGDFSLWEPVVMEKEGNQWSVTMEIPYGIYHYGFLADDQWFLPEDAPDAVPDEWGRRNATMVIEGGIPVPLVRADTGTEGAAER